MADSLVMEPQSSSDPVVNRWPETYDPAAETFTFEPHNAEILHRVCAGLQIVASLVHNAERQVKQQQDWTAAIDSLRSVRGHIGAIAKVQQLLHDTKIVPDATQSLLVALMANLQTIYGRKRVTLTIVEAANIPVRHFHDAGLIVCELMTNALRHGFRDGEDGALTVRVTALACDTIRLVVQDDGIGCPPDVEYHTSHGLGLVNDLAEGAGGQLERLPSARGTAWRVDLASA